jgi:hypothetical protein
VAIQESRVRAAFPWIALMSLVKVWVEGICVRCRWTGG